MVVVGYLQFFMTCVASPTHAHTLVTMLLGGPRLLIHQTKAHLFCSWPLYQEVVPLFVACGHGR